jgi:hypothetical protein
VSAPASARCRGCGAELAERQRWCLTCGSAALMLIATPRRWARVGAAATLVALLALVGIGYAIAAVLSS